MRKALRLNLNTTYTNETKIDTLIIITIICLPIYFCRSQRTYSEDKLVLLPLCESWELNSGCQLVGTVTHRAISPTWEELH